MKKASEVLPMLDPTWVAPSEAPKGPTEEQIDEWFEHFWALAWDKTAKQKARESFGRQVMCREDAVVIWKAAKAHAPAILARAEASTRGTPIMPSTWLNQQRYLEPPPVMPGRRPTVFAVDPSEIEAQRREVTPEQMAAINAATLAMMRRELADPRCDDAQREWIYREFPELRGEARG